MTRRHAYPDVEAIRELPALISQVIPARWQDQNGHINVSFYMALYNESGWPMFDLIGVDESYFTQRKMGFVDLGNHISYLNELHIGDRVTAYGRFFGHDRKRMHGMVLTVNDDTNRLASTIEFLAISMDLEQRRHRQTRVRCTRAKCYLGNTWNQRASLSAIWRRPFTCPTSV